MLWQTFASRRGAVLFGLALILVYRLGFRNAQRATRKGLAYIHAVSNVTAVNCCAGKKAVGAVPKESSQNTTEAHTNRKRKADAKARDRKLALARAGEVIVGAGRCMLP